jgi:TonB-linked SusC/RagA family outer membrane protein
MKLTILFMLLGLMQISASVYSQTARLSLEMRNARVIDVLEQIEKQSEFRFAYSAALIDLERRVSVSINEKNIVETLDAVFAGTGIKHVTRDRHIMLYPEELDTPANTEEQQQKTVSGKVTDSKGLALPGVTVLIKGTSNGTVTNNEGTYSLNNVSEAAIMVFSFVGMHTQEIIVGSQSNINVFLEEETIGLEEVVAIGYGTVKKSDLTGSVSAVKMEDFKKMPMASLDQGIQGRAAGVQVTNTSGAPGGQVSIRIRGGNSLSSSNEPLYVIDGFPIAAGGMAGGYQNSTLANNPMATINPNDIESIEILKDASAAAIYGSRGANGVVLITTKHGKAGKTKVSYEGYAGVQNVTKTLDMMNGEEFATMSNVAASNAGLAPIYGGANEKWKEPSYYRDNSTDWQSLIFQQAKTHSHQIGLSGGSENTQYVVTGNYFSQEGVVLNSDFDRASLRTNIDTKISDWVKVGVSLTASRTFSNLTTSESDGANGGGVINGALAVPPTMPVYNTDGSFTTLNQTPYGVTTGNPYALALLAKDQSTIDRVLANASIKFDLDMLLNGLGAEIRGGTDYSAAFRDTNYPSTVQFAQSQKGIAAKSWNRQASYLIENLVTYQTSFGKHSINAVTGLTLQSFEYSNGQTIVSGFVNDILEDNSMGSASVVVGIPSSGRNSSTQASWLGRVNYNFSDRYLLTFTGRADGSSKFGTNNKWGFFPSVAAAWRVSQEDFMQNADWLDNLKVRASYGITGNQGFANYASLASLGQYSYNFNAAKSVGFAPNKIPNSDLKWETTSTLDFGTDFGFFENRLNFTLDYYHKNTENLLWNVTIPLTSGFSSIFKNHGTLQNWGFEATVGYNLVNGTSKSAFNWTTTLMYSMNRNEIVSLPGITPGRTTNLSGHLKLDGSWMEEGYPVGVWNYYVYDGVYQDQEMLNATIVNANGETVLKHPKSVTTDGLGSPKFKDLNQDGKIDRNDWTIIGDPNPDFIFSWSNDFTYKNFDLNIFVNGSYGNDILNMGRGENAQISPFASQRKSMLNYWTPANTNTDIPTPRISPHPNLILSSWMIEDGSYIRLKNVVLGYRVPVKRGIESLRFYVSGQNLVTLTNYSGFDPEVNSRGQSNLQMGIDWNAYPTSRTFTLGVNIVL